MSELVREFLERLAEQIISDGRRVKESSEFGSFEMPSAQKKEGSGNGDPQDHGEQEVLFHVSPWKREVLVLADGLQ